MTPAYIGMGSNLQDPLLQLRLAYTALKALSQSRVDRVSGLYRSTAVGPGSQPDYLNAAACLFTALPPETLLEELQRIEQAQGRVRSEQWGPRTLDLDILLYGDISMTSASLTIPHPRIPERNFVLYPLREISDTTLVLPGGEDIDTLVQNCPGAAPVRTEFGLVS